MTHQDLDDSVESPDKAYHERAEADPFKAFTYDDLTPRGEVNLDINWLCDEPLEGLGDLPAPEIIAREIVDDLSAALEEFAAAALEQPSPDAGAV